MSHFSQLHFNFQLFVLELSIYIMYFLHETYLWENENRII